MDLEYSTADREFQNEVRCFLEESLPTRLREGAAASPAVFVEPDIGQDWNAVLHAKGWLAYQWPATVGGPGWTPTQRYIFEKECALAGAPGLTGLSLKLVAPVIYTFGTEIQRAELLPRILSGEDYWCQGFSEPGAGSDLASLQCGAVRDGDHYIVNGSKIWTTHAHHANKMFCLVRTSAEGRPQAGITFLLIDMTLPGISIRPIVTLAGDHEVNQVFLDDVMVRVTDRLGDEGDGWKITKFLLENERGGSCYAPELQAHLGTIEHAAKTEPDGHSRFLADDLHWQRRVARVRLRITALELIELRILADIAKGRSPGPRTSLTKMSASNLKQDLGLLGMDVYGDAGLQLNPNRPFYGDNAPPPIHSRDAQLAAPRYLNSRAWTIFGGTNEVQADIIAKTVLSL